ncbi:histidine kinase [Sporomusaceae bacterium FL31]|nr:histidine kinase [Sporomusaceae bacterium FL31]GCE32854.1 histidine kinase [Sporomusaceae bacterium]
MKAQPEQSAFYYEQHLSELKFKNQELNRRIQTLEQTILQHQKQQKILQESEEQFRQMFAKQQAILFLVDPQTLLITDANDAAQQFYGFSANQFNTLQVNDLCADTDMTIFFEKVKFYSSYYGEFKHHLASGAICDVEIYASAINLTYRQVLFCIVHDITARKQAENRLHHIGFHDALTGLKNRSYFEKELQRLELLNSDSLGLIICDLDGLKLVNDTLGHHQGDKHLTAISAILKECFHDSDVLARIGGDEFAIIKTGATVDYIQSACAKAVQKINDHNVAACIPLGLSFGYSISKGTAYSIKRLIVEADNSMYREKLQRGSNARSAIVQNAVKLLNDRDFICDGHADRLQSILSKLALVAGISDSKLPELTMLARFHDIGKVGIPDSIIFKPDKLTSEEMSIMQRHSEIGQRIALSSSELIPIADLILKHHEHWDGSGYPLGLAGNQIPLMCRIFAIADAYDVMTNGRPYRKALTPLQALEQIRLSAGTQFDPVLVNKFCTLTKLI